MLLSARIRPMRLRDVSTILNRHCPVLSDVQVEHAQMPDKTAASRVLNAAQIRLAVEAISQIGALQETGASVLAHPVLLMRPGQLFPNNEVAQFSQLLAIFAASANQLRVVVDAMLPPEDPTSVLIRIPQPKDLGDLEHIIKSLRLGFERPTAMILKAGLRFSSFDVGSSWLEIATDGSNILGFILALYAACSTYAKQRRELSRGEDFYRNAQQLEALAAMQKANSRTHRPWTS